MATSVGSLTAAAPPPFGAAGSAAASATTGSSAASPFASQQTNGNPPSFTAFPSSYAGFGTDGAFGTVGLLGGRLTVVAANGSASPANGSAAANPNDPATATLAKTPASSPAHATSGADPSGTSPGIPSPPPDPTKGLVGADPPPLPGVPNPPAPGLQPPNLDPAAQQSPYPPGIQPPDLEQTPTGTPGTSTQPSAYDQQLAAQQQADQQAAAQAQAQTEAAFGQLHNVNLRLSDAYANGNSAAVQQLNPIRVQIQNGTLQGSIWAGLGTPQPQPFAQPEIPAVFLNVAS